MWNNLPDDSETEISASIFRFNYVHLSFTATALKRQSGPCSCKTISVCIFNALSVCVEEHGKYKMQNLFFCTPCLPCAWQTCIWSKYFTQSRTHWKRTVNKWKDLSAADFSAASTSTLFHRSVFILYHCDHVKIGWFILFIHNSTVRGLHC